MDLSATGTFGPPPSAAAGAAAAALNRSIAIGGAAASSFPPPQLDSTIGGGGGAGDAAGDTASLGARIRSLEAELAMAGAARDQSDAALRAEVSLPACLNCCGCCQTAASLLPAPQAREGSEARAYIAVLERALQTRATDAGLGGNAATLMTQVRQWEGRDGSRPDANAAAPTPSAGRAPLGPARGRALRGCGAGGGVRAPAAAAQGDGPGCQKRRGSAGNPPLRIVARTGHGLWGDSAPVAHARSHQRRQPRAAARRRRRRRGIGGVHCGGCGCCGWGPRRGCSAAARRGRRARGRHGGAPPGASVAEQE